MEVLEILLKEGGVFGLTIALFMFAYKSGQFLAPLFKDFIATQSANQRAISNTLAELAELQKITNVRLAAIEKQLQMFEGIL